MKKNINIRYFAILKEEAEKSTESFETKAETAEGLFQELSELYGFTLKASQVRVAVNDEFKDLDTKLNPEDTVVFIPPVAGG